MAGNARRRNLLLWSVILSIAFAAAFWAALGLGALAVGIGAGVTVAIVLAFGGEFDEPDEDA
jgi:hypothetical protein